MRSRLPIPTRINLIVIGLQLVAFVGIVVATAHAHAGWEVVLLAVAFAVVGNSIYATIHEAEHGLLHPSRKVNDFLGASLALLFPAPYHLIRQGHLGHHMRNRSDDEAFDLYFAGESPLLKHLLLYGIITGFYWMLVVSSNLAVLVFPFLMRRRFFEFDRPSAAFMESLNPKYWRLIQFEAICALALHAGIIIFLSIPFWRYLAVYFGFGFTWSAMQYVHHYGTERDVLLGSRNLWLFAPIDWVWLHHNWHRTHHRHPTIPWIYLPRAGRREDPKREFLVWHYLRMWRGAQRATDPVENRYAGRVIR